MPGSEALTGEGLTDYYMIPSDNLPILEPLLLIPGIGQPLYDLLEPNTQILVNLGYGSIAEGWNQRPANEPTTFGLYPDINQTQLSDALSNGWQQGVTDALHALQSPVSYQDQVAPLLAFADSWYTTGYAPENPSFTCRRSSPSRWPGSGSTSSPRCQPWGSSVDSAIAEKFLERVQIRCRIWLRER